jgi:hypothetical protein
MFHMRMMAQIHQGRFGLGHQLGTTLIILRVS